MNTVVWILLCGAIGSAIGWIASVALRVDAPLRVPLNLAVGALGAILGGWLLSPEFGSSLYNRGSIPLSGIGASSLGAMALVSLASFLWHGKRT